MYTPLFIGIDIGSERLHVCTLQAGQDPKTADVLIVNVTDPRWPDQLAFIQHGHIVALEPTGWHYSAAIVRFLQNTGAFVIQVEHRTTPKVRSLFINDIKNDKTDAKALALCARMYPAFGGMHMHQPGDHLDAVTGLRFLLHDHQRAVQTATRSVNRLRQLSRAIWPSLSFGIETYLRAARIGYVTPDELRQLAQTFDSPNALHAAYRHGKARNALVELVETLPSWLTGSALAPAIMNEVNRLVDAETAKEKLYERLVDDVMKPPFTELSALWYTVPCASAVGIAALHVATRGEAQLLTLTQFKAAVGSHPRVSQSGETAEASMARQGYRPAKTALYLWTMQLIKAADNSVFAAYERHKTDPKRKFNIQAARGQLCAILSSIARHHVPYQNEAQS